ncbi:uncharacterized protein PV06_04105 [Exophiala oligosperma]|uniref:Phytanoyl-CoA dioxygenase n=1 Tax=Exophiala oligosperma TaxID=215243 RepID=A0A0D2ECN6_9EURO|nr:uncharacterized protein PV06_04105 [Exophiala oligosperma]KIW45744.1 hypothetical protein PV06_04105 [Exophiala oligosperma]
MPAVTLPDIQLSDGPLLPDQLGWLRPSDPNTPIELLRERFKEDHYLFLKGLLPREHVLKARESYFRLLSASGVLKPGTAPIEGIFDQTNDLSNFAGLSSRVADLRKPKSERAATFADLTARAHTEKWYTEQFCKHPNLIDFVGKLTEWKDVRLFERSLFRCNLPNTSPVGVHYDQIFLRQGDVTNITAWCAIGDVKLNGGGLMYLEKSAKIGESIEAEFTRRSRENGFSEEEAKNAYNKNMVDGGGDLFQTSKPTEFASRYERKWLVSAFEAGDVVFHDPFTIHASSINTDEDGVIRLSTDLRYYDASRPYDKRWTRHFYPGDEL